MSIKDKISSLGKMKKKDLLELQNITEVKQMDLDLEKDELMKKIVAQRETILERSELEDAKGVERAKEVLDILEKNYADKNAMFKDNLETLKAIAQIFKIREERKASARSRLLGFCGVFISVAGIGLAYGSDTLGTLVNKKTFEAAKTAVTRFIPKM